MKRLTVQVGLVCEAEHDQTLLGQVPHAPIIHHADTLVVTSMQTQDDLDVQICSKNGEIQLVEALRFDPWHSVDMRRSNFGMEPTVPSFCLGTFDPHTRHLSCIRRPLVKV